jgi:hypothetical protein
MYVRKKMERQEGARVPISLPRVCAQRPTSQWCHRLMSKLQSHPNFLVLSLTVNDFVNQACLMETSTKIQMSFGELLK